GRVRGRAPREGGEAFGGAAGVRPRLPGEVDGGLRQHGIRQVRIRRQRAEQLGRLGRRRQRTGRERAQLLASALGGGDRLDQPGRAELPGFHCCVTGPFCGYYYLWPATPSRRTSSTSSGGGPSPPGGAVSRSSPVVSSPCATRATAQVARRC